MVDDLALELGDSRFDGRLEIQGGPVPYIDINLHSARFDLTPWFPVTQTPADEATSQPGKDQRVIPDTAIPYPVLAKANLDFNVKIDHLVRGERDLSDAEFVGVVSDGRLAVDNFSLVGESGGKLSGSLGLAPEPEGALLRLKVAGSRLELGLPASTEAERQALPRYDLSLGVESRGATVREMAASLNGYVRLTGGAGRVRAGTMRMFTQDFLSELLHTVNPFMQQDPYSDIKCSVILISLADGRLTGKPIAVIQSDRLKVVARAAINLADESLDADISTVPQKGLGLSLSNLVNPYIKVKGTLANPVLAIDKQSTLIEGGAAIATGGFSILAKGLFDRMSSAPDPCRKAIDDSRQAFDLLEEKYGGGVSLN